MKKTKTFTLLEVIMAVTITVVILAVIASGFNLAMKVYRRVKEGKTSQVSDFMEEISGDLSSVYLYDNVPSLVFKGDSDSITFVTVIPLRHKFKYFNGGSLRKVKYYLVSEGNNNNSVYKSSFLFAGGEFSKEIRKEKFIDSPSLLKFSYYNGKKWLNAWSSSKELPRAVRISVKLGNNANSDYDVFATTVDIPCR